MGLIMYASTEFRIRRSPVSTELISHAHRKVYFLGKRCCLFAVSGTDASFPWLTPFRISRIWAVSKCDRKLFAVRF